MAQMSGQIKGFELNVGSLIRNAYSGFGLGNELDQSLRLCDWPTLQSDIMSVSLCGSSTRITV